MFKLYSKGCEYAIRALVHVASEQKAGRFQAHAICEGVGIPESYTRKIFQALVQGGFLSAVRGPGGGYEVTRDLLDVSILDVIHAVDGPDSFKGCILGMQECSGAHPCPLHAMWVGAKTSLLEELENKKIRDLTPLLRKPQARRKAVRNPAKG